MRDKLVLAALCATLAGCQNAESVPDNAFGGTRATAFQIDKVSLPGEGRGDYIFADPDARRLYVTHGAVIHILDLDTLGPIAQVTGFKAAHGVTIADGKGYASDGGGNAVIVFEPATGRTITRIPAGQNPDSILTDPASGKIFVFNGTTQDVTVIDPATNKALKTIALGDKPEYSRADGKGKIWVNLEDSAAIAEIDTATLTVVRRIELPDCAGPAALGFDAANRRLFSSCGNKELKVVDADSGAVVAHLPVGEDADGIVYDPVRKRIYVANRDGGWTIVDQADKDRYSVNQTLPIDPYAKTAAHDPKTHRVFSSTADLVWPKPVPGKRLLPDAKPGSFRLMVISEK